MDKIKRYLEVNIPVTTCTLRCDYCYITHHRLFEGPLPKFKYSPQHVRKALSVKRLGGKCLINMCASGETLLAPNITEYIYELLEEGHYVSIVTNATVSKRFEELEKIPKHLLSHLFFKFSYHYTQLKKRGLLETFFNNVCRMRDSGASFTLEATPSDEWIPYIDEMKEIAIKHVGAVNHITIARDERDSTKLPILTKMSKEKYIKTWSVFNSTLFNYKMSIFENKRTEFCYAGAWSLFLNLQTGIARQCYKSDFVQNIFEDLSKPIEWRAVGNNCKEHHCYNGHSFIVLGCIPELSRNAPTYAQERNRTCNDGSEWLQPAMKAFMSTKLYESNKEFNWWQKWITNMKNRHIGLRSKIISRIPFLH